MNEEDEDMDLGLVLGSNNSWGAGVNANIKTNMAFAASDNLYELVWLPHKGLSLKTTCSTLADRKPFLRWNSGRDEDKENHSLVVLESSLPKEESQHIKKGKGKALYENESNESVESCSSIGLISECNKRKKYDQSLGIESKSLKKSFHGSHSSFKNWISNMVKGVSDSYKEETSGLDLTLALTNPKQGFDCNKTHDSSSCFNKGFQTMFQSLYHQQEEEEEEESKEIMVNDKEISDNGENGVSYKEIVQSNEPYTEPMLVLEPQLGEDKDTGGIMAFSSTDLILPGKSNYLNSLWLTRHSTRIQQLESPQVIEESSRKNDSGKSTHNSDRKTEGKKKKKKIEESEMEDLLVRISSYGKKKKMSLRCFKSDHRAISCPPSSFTVPALNSNLPFMNISEAQNVHVPLLISDAIKKLRLSRADILRWKNSHAVLRQFNGFFLRLRLGKSESGKDDTAYYVARITESTTDDRSQNYISVDVGGIKSSIGSQYISNHDFLEDEIKAWWHRILKTGSNFPSLDELNSKMIHKTSLGV